jgi:uncharacterized protein with LGFP repeats
MAGEQGRSGTVVGRAALGLLALATAFGFCTALWAPVAAASPLGDADNAITAAWKDAGGDHSDLGAKQGDCYAAGQGFAQDFVHGKMFFTPATGAKSMSGAVLDKYEALGGPAASDLGFPTINEVPGLAGPDSRVSTFSASDKPVIFWTSAHGAFVVRGAINAAWDKLGSSGGALGVPVSDETYDGELATQAFSSGRVSWNRMTKAFTTVPPDLAKQLTDLQVPIDPTAAINMAWRAAGGPSGALGAKQGDEYPVGGGGLAQNFAGGKVFFSPATGANAVESDILAKYEALGGPAGGNLGFPIADEADGGLTSPSRLSPFSAGDKPVIFWTPDHGAFVVRGAMKAAWDKLGGPTGELGVPVGDQTVTKDVVTQTFTGGQISWNLTNNMFSSQPANLASSLSGVHVPGQTMPSGSASAAGGGSALDWHRWWLPVGVPALLLIGIAGLVTWGWRRRRRARRDAEAAEPGGAEEARFDTDHEAITDSVPQWSPDADSELASSGLSDGDRVQLRPRTVRLPSQLVDEPPADEIGSAAELSDLDEDLREHFDEHIDEHFDEHIDEHIDEDPDDVDTAPTRIPAPSEVRSGRHAAADDEDDTTHFAAAASIMPGQLAIHLPMDDPYEVPDGYPVKANASFGLYYMPDNVLYEDTLAEIWFANEQIAQANGFTKAE